MSVKDFKAKEIIIGIKPRKDDGKSKRRPGMIPPIKKPDDFLPRRDNDTESGIFLDVYDMGAAADGSDVGYRQDATISFWSSPLNFTFGNTNFTNTFNAMFAGPSPSTASYLRLTADNILRFGTSAGNFATAEFSETRGFRGGGDLIIPNGPAWQMFNSMSGGLGGLAYTKITNGSYSDPDAVFSIDRDAEVFLAPRIWLNYGFANNTVWGLGTGSPATAQDAYIANYCLEPLSREYFLNNPAWESYKGGFLFAKCHNNFYARGSDTFPTPFGTGIIPPRTADTPADLKTSWRTFQQTKAGARLSKSEFVPFVDPVVTTPATTAFPAYVPGVAYNNAFPLPYYTFSDAQNQTSFIDPGLFLGAVRLKPKGSTPEQWFYFYRKAGGSVFSQGCAGGTAAGGGALFGDRYSVRV